MLQANSRNFYSVPSCLLDALTDAYREANGLPPITPPPDTAPDNPLQLE